MESKIEQLKSLIADGETFTFDNFSIQEPGHDTRYGGADSADWLTWKTRVLYVVKGIAHADSAPMRLCEKARHISTEGNYSDNFERQKSMLLKALTETSGILEGDPFQESAKQKTIAKSVVLSNRIFIVHGHDHQLKTELEVFLKDLGLEAVVLHRQPDEGKTIIEKFEKHADVGFAFVLLTPDEVSYAVDQAKISDGERKKEVRARPNVIFEFGFFVGKLGRNRVCCLLKGEVARPSDIDGLVYKDASSGIESIGYAIMKELKAAGYAISF